MVRKAVLVVASLALLAGCDTDAATPTSITEPQLAAVGRGHGALGTVYVRSQGLYYDTFVTVQNLPMHGRFQKLEDGETDFGPGDRGYLAGRWWVDVNGNDIQDEGDAFVLCPLLPPGRPTP